MTWKIFMRSSLLITCLIAFDALKKFGGARTHTNFSFLVEYSISYVDLTERLFSIRFIGQR